jgi:hypothetical protein
MIFNFSRVHLLIALPILLVGVFTPLGVVQAASAAIAFGPASGSYAVDASFTVSIVVDTADMFNSANATVTFDPTMLSVTGVSKTTSAFSLWAVEPSSDNTKGTVVMEGGNATPLTGTKTLLAITFKGLKQGKTEVKFGNVSVLAADGKGTDILATKGVGTYEITPPGTGEQSAPPPPEEPAELIPKPEPPEITSTTHPDPELYSSSPIAKFEWAIPDDVTAVRVVLDTKENTIPTTNYDPAIYDKEFDELVEGVMWLHVRARNESGWGGTSHRKILVDKTPPEEFSVDATVAASTTDAVLSFSATDTRSGIERYEVILDGGSPIKVTVADVQSKGGYTLSDQSPGEHSVSVKAFDRAGNSRAAEGSFTIEGTLEQTAAAGGADDLEEKPTDWKLYIIIALIALIAFLTGYIVYERRAFAHEKFLTKREADELRDHLATVFAAMREEAGEQMARIFQLPNPSAMDREVLENVNEAIDLSEELLAKEVEDVRKLLS